MKGSRGQEQTSIVLETVAGGIDIALGCRDYAVTVAVDAAYLLRVCIEQSFRKRRARFERGQPLVGIEVNLMGQAAWNETLPEFTLLVGVSIELVRVARARCAQQPGCIGVVAITKGVVFDA